MDSLESRVLFNAAFDLVHITDLRNDPIYASIDGSGVGVAILDTGLDAAHPDLSGGYLGGSDFTDDGVPANQDVQGHGTHVAGTIGSRNARLGIATASGLLGLQVLGADGRGTMDVIATALDWVVANQERYNIRVVNMSLGVGVNVTSDPNFLPSVTAAIQNAERHGITVVSAAGNDYVRYQVMGVSYPAIASTISVGAVQHSRNGLALPDDLAEFSQRYDFSRMILAPGVDIESTWPGGRTRTISGTSMASPTVAGVVALMQDAAQTFGGRYLTPDEVREMLLTSAIQVNDLENPRDNVANSNHLYKRLDAYAAVALVRQRLNPDAPPPPPDDPGNTIPDDPTGTRGRATTLVPAGDGSIEFLSRQSMGYDGGTTRVGPRDVDVFRVDAAAFGQLTVTLSTDTESPQDFDSYLRLFDANGTEIGSNDDGIGTTFSSLAGQLTAGTYYLAVSGKPNTGYAIDDLGTRGDGAQGNYVISVTLIGAGQGGDLDGTIARATEMLVGSTRTPTVISGVIGTDSGSAVGPGDIDLYAFYAPDEGFLLFDIDSLGATWADTYLAVYNGAGQLNDFSDDNAATNAFGDAVEQTSGELMVNIADNSPAGRARDSFIRISVGRGSLVYIGVSNFENRGYNPLDAVGRDPANAPGDQGAYTLNVGFSSIDVNGSIDRAVQTTTIPGNASGDIGFDQGTLQTGDKDVDFFVLRPSSPGLLVIDVQSNFDPVLYAYDENGTQLGVNDDFSGLDPRVLLRVFANVSYYFAVTGYGNEGFDPFAAGTGTGGDTGSYVVAWQMTDADDYTLYSNDGLEFQGVTAIAADGRVDADLGMDGPLIIGNKDVDLYRFTATETGFLAVYAFGDDAFDADAVVRLFDVDGHEITTSVDSVLDGRTDDFLFAAVTAGQTYLIGISGAGPDSLHYDPGLPGSARAGAVGPYQLSVGFGTQRPNLESSGAVRITSGGSVTGVTITAGNYSTPGSAASFAAFIVDFNRDGQLGEGEIVGTDETPGDGFSYTLSTDSRWAPGGYLVGSMIFDDNGVPSNLATTLYQIRPALTYRAFYPEGWANEQTIDQFIPMVNPNDVAVHFVVIAHYERRPTGDAGAPLSIVLAEGDIAPQSRGGVSITTRGGIGRSLVELNRGYALEVQSDGPLGAVLSHYDNFNPQLPAAGVATGEALTSLTSRSWYFSQVIKNPGSNFEFLLFFNPNDQAATVTVSFLRDGGQTASATFPVYANSRWGLAINDLPALTNGTYGVVVTSDIGIVGAQSAYTTDGRGDSSIGLPGETGGAAPTFGTFPFIDRTPGITASLAFINPNDVDTTVHLTGRNEAGDTVTVDLFVAAKTVATTDVSWAGTDVTPLSVDYTSDQPVAGTVFQNSTDRGDSTFYPANVRAATEWAVADAYLNRSQVGDRYFEHLNVFNASDTAATVSIDFLLYDFRSPVGQANGGRSIRVTRTYNLGAREFVSIPVHAPDSVVVTFDNRPEVHFSIVASSTNPLYVTFTHWDLNQGGGWDTWATPIPNTGPIG